MSIDKHLLRDERILASVKIAGATLYATNKRIIRYSKGIFRETVYSLYYSHITSISLESKSFIWAVILGALIAVLGAFAGGYIGITFLLVGVALVLIGVFYKRAWYQIKAVGLSDKDLELWRITNVGAPDVERFARFVEDQITKGPER